MFSAFLALALSSVVAVPMPSSDARGAVKEDKPIYITAVTLGEIDPAGKVPAVNGVPGAGVDNWDVPLPLAVLHVGQAYKTMLTFQDSTYTGPCHGDFALVQNQGGHKVDLDAFTIFTPACTAGLVYLVSTTGHVLPDSPGPATAIVTMTFGKDKVTMKVPMIVE